MSIKILFSESTILIINNICCIFKVNKMMSRNITIIIGIVIFVLIVIFFVPLVDEFETFN